MKPLIVYFSSSGFTRQYAQWLQERLDCDLCELSTVKSSDLNPNRSIIIGSSVHAGKLTKFNQFKERVLFQNYHQLVVFGVGCAPANEKTLNQIKQNHQSEIQEDAQFYYLPGGLNYQKMTFFDALAMRTFAFAMKQQAKKGKFDLEWAEKLKTSYDLTDQTLIDPIIDDIQAKN